MRLINVHSLELKEFVSSSSDAPRYAILSHTWGDDEVTFQDMMNPDRRAISGKEGFSKIKKTCEIAQRNGLDYAWVDTCCIDKTSSAELTEAINSMFRWYQDSAACYAWLSDLAPPRQADLQFSGSRFKACRWFTRGWTLQELIAPRRLDFYDQDWNWAGDKMQLCNLIAEVTSISANILRNPRGLPRLSIAQRMSWAAMRQTTRVEDLAYCLLGIFGVNMPLVYGEGSRAFIRLQEEIAKDSNDYSLFAWTNRNHPSVYRGVLATHPSNFSDSGSIRLTSDSAFRPEYTMTNKGLDMNNFLLPEDNGDCVMDLHCVNVADGGSQQLGIWISPLGGGVYGRIRCRELATFLPGSTILKRRTILSKGNPNVSIIDRGLNFKLRHNFNQSDATHYPNFPFEATMMRPMEAWKPDARTFESGKASEFHAYVLFTLREHFPISEDLADGASFVVSFGKADCFHGLWVSIDSTVAIPGHFQPFKDTENVDFIGSTRTTSYVALPNTRMEPSCLVSVTMEEVNTGHMQVSYILDLELSDINNENR